MFGQITCPKIIRNVHLWEESHQTTTSDEKNQVKQSMFVVKHAMVHGGFGCQMYVDAIVTWQRITSITMSIHNFVLWIASSYWWSHMLKCCGESHNAVYCDPPIKCNSSFMGLLSISSCMPYTLHRFPHSSQYSLRWQHAFEHHAICMRSSICNKANFGAFWLSWTFIFHNVNFHHSNFTYNIYILMLHIVINRKLVHYNCPLHLGHCNLWKENA